MHAAKISIVIYRRRRRRLARVISPQLNTSHISGIIQRIANIKATEASYLRSTRRILILCDAYLNSQHHCRYVVKIVCIIFKPANNWFVFHSLYPKLSKSRWKHSCSLNQYSYLSGQNVMCVSRFSGHRLFVITWCQQTRPNWHTNRPRASVCKYADNTVRHSPQFATEHICAKTILQKTRTTHRYCCQSHQWHARRIRRAAAVHLQPPIPPTPRGPSSSSTVEREWLRQLLS